ncbi:MAG: 1-acyl-sn-glycerol-3-phosphate acyltransferase [Ruminococcaceae bacterium]|nr:1-acyl-sn-glycerol-3-phosphate acyltransferase [Oscillospiraceae bacterium]
MIEYRQFGKDVIAMKIRTREKTYEEVLTMPVGKHRKPRHPNFLLRSIVRVAAIPDILKTHFQYEMHGMEQIKGQPCLILMNHSSFIDLMIVSRIFYPKPYGIVCTGDGFVGKEWIMRFLGCIPTQKFVSDVTLIRDMEYMLKEKKASVLMYPEASYTFDGTATPLPRKMGILLKKLGVPVVTVITEGAFARDPLYNCLQKRKVKVRAKVSCMVTAEQLKEKSVRELDKMLDEAFSFDNFAWQRDNQVEITEPFRADGLERILYKCPHCSTEGEMTGKGTTLTCRHCGKMWEMDTLGQLKATEGETEFSHIPDWYRWEREEVRRELESGAYRMETDVDIGMMVNFKAIYMVGKGHLSHTQEGFRLTGCDGKLEYEQGALACYGLYADYYWYELGDMICVGNRDVLYYCFPSNRTPVAKTRMAVEELYKLKKPSRIKEMV